MRTAGVNVGGYTDVCSLLSPVSCPPGNSEWFFEITGLAVDPRHIRHKSNSPIFQTDPKIKVSQTSCLYCYGSVYEDCTL